MRQELSLRGLARALGYSVATLSEHRNAGIFRALPNGKYDLEAVVKGLLASTSPSPEHRTKLEVKRAVEPAIAEQEDVVLPPQQEAGVQAAMKHLRDEKFQAALNVLHDLPVRMARDMSAADPKVSFRGAVQYFEKLVLNDVQWVFNLARKGVVK